MLEKLKAINWNEDYDPILFGGNLAEALLELNAAENQAEFSECLQRMYLDIQNSHPVEPAVEFVMPYIVWMCQHTPYAETRIQYCFVIGTLFDVIWAAKLDFGSLFLPTSFTDTLRQRAAIYDAVADHTAYFCELLTADDDATRLAGFAVLQWLADEYTEILPQLVPCFETTNNMWVQALAIWYYALFAKRDWKLTNSSVEQLYQWMLSENDLLRFTATLGRLHCHPIRSENRDAIPEIVLNNMVDCLNSDVAEIFQLIATEEYRWLVRGALPFDVHVFDLLRGVTYNQAEPFFWFELIKRIDLTPIEAHRHCRELMRYAFLPAYHPSSSLFWNTYHDAIKVKVGEPILYHHYQTDRNRQEIRRNQSKRTVLAFIVNCDPFWEHPTNLFSHYYGLPDDRKALRALL